MSGRVIHSSGPYEGREIEEVVEVDPAYILELVTTTKGHGISQQVQVRARQLLDTWMEEDRDELEELGYFFDRGNDYDSE